MNINPIIDATLWDAARWRKSIFLVTEDLDAQPGLALCFENLEAGRQIFSDWQSRFAGIADSAEQLRVVVIRGRHPDGRNGFTLGIGTETLPAPGMPLPTKPEYVAVYYRSRFQAADEPQQTLDWFQASYVQHRMFFLIPLSIKAVDGGSIEPDFSACIGKTRIYFRTVEEVLAGGPDDQDAGLIAG